MDAARRALCQDDPLNPLITTALQVSGILVISHFFNLILKPLGQPGPIAQILAGIVLGPSLVSRIDRVNNYFIQPLSADYYVVFSLISCILFMFLIGLETDLPYLKRNIRKVSIIAYGGLVVCMIFGVASSFFIIHILRIKSNKFAFTAIIMLILCNTASPVVFRLTTEMKFATADIGRLAIASSLVTEMTCILLFSTFLSFFSWKSFGKGILFLVMMIALIFLNKYLAAWCNQRNHNQKYVTNSEVLIILFFLITLSFVMEKYGQTSTLSSFLIGLTFPREGKTTRTLLHKLPYAVNNFILPIYFGYIGFQFDVNYLKDYRHVIVVVLMVILSIGGKIIGTLVSCNHLKIPINEGTVLCFMLNLKGFADLLLPRAMPTNIISSWQGHHTHSLAITVVVLDTMIAGPTVAYLLQKYDKYFSHKHTSFEFHEPDTELRILACVYNSRHISAKLGLISAMNGSRDTPITTYLWYLVELPKKRNKKNLMYHQLDDGDQFSDEEDYGGNDVLEINNAVDAYAVETKVSIHQRKIVSSFSTMYEDVCNAIEDLRVSMILLDFHKHQRLDGKMESGKEGIRSTNQKILRHAPCSVGIFVDRGQTGFQQPRSELIQNAATLFFGGPDDREALAYSKRICSHHHINLTVIRFILTASSDQNEHVTCSSQKNDELLMTVSSPEIEGEADIEFLQDFYNKYVTSGKVTYMEKLVSNGMQTTEVIRSIGQVYSLFIVGKGGRGQSPMTTGMSDWEECPELGVVGDLLASSELDISGSVLVIQQHRLASHGFRDD